jgi:hypothetical protein
MKKTLLTFVTLFVLISCSKEDASNTESTNTPTEETEISAIKFYTGDATSPYREIFTDKNNKIKSMKFYEKGNTTVIANYVYTGDLITQINVSNTITSTKTTTNIMYDNLKRISKKTIIRNDVTIQIATFKYDDIMGKRTYTTDNYTNGTLSSTSTTDYQYSNSGNLTVAVTKSSTVIISQSYDYDTNNLSNKNIFSNIIGLDKFVDDVEYGSKNIHTKYTYKIQDALTYELTEPIQNFRRVMTYNSNLFPTKVESFFRLNSDSEEPRGTERIEYK